MKHHLSQFTPFINNSGAICDLSVYIGIGCSFRPVFSKKRLGGGRHHDNAMFLDVCRRCEEIIEEWVGIAAGVEEMDYLMGPVDRMCWWRCNSCLSEVRSVIECGGVVHS